MFTAQYLYTICTTKLTWKLLHNITHFVKNLKIIYTLVLLYKIKYVQKLCGKHFSISKTQLYHQRGQHDIIQIGRHQKVQKAWKTAHTKKNKINLCSLINLTSHQKLISTAGEGVRRMFGFSYALLHLPFCTKSQCFTTINLQR